MASLNSSHTGAQTYNKKKWLNLWFETKNIIWENDQMVFKTKFTIIYDRNDLYFCIL